MPSLKLQKYFSDYRAIVKLGLPILVSQLGMIVVGFADNIMVGHYSTEALASASFVNNLFNVAIFACMGFTYGLTPVVATLFTRKENLSIGRNVKAAVIANLVFALIVTCIMSGFYINLERMGQPVELLPTIRPYFIIYLCGVVPVALFSVFAQWSYGIRNTSMPMWITLGGNVMNIIGNYGLIYGNFGLPEMGLTGAGISTLISRYTVMIVIMGIFFIKRSNSEYATGFKKEALRDGDISRINRISWPVSMQMTFESGSFTFAAVVAGWLGALELAAFQVFIIISTLGFCIYYSIGSSVSVLVANEAGLSDRRNMRRVAWAGYHVILLCAVCASSIFILFGHDLIHVFTDDPRVISLAMTLIAPLLLYQLGDATQINFANALRGTSKVMPMLWIAFICYLVIGAPATYIFAFPLGMGLFGIILSFSVSLFIAAGSFLFYFLHSTRY